MAEAISITSAHEERLLMSENSAQLFEEISLPRYA